MSFQRYPAYKDSGVEWLGKIPSHWGSGHLRWLARIFAGGTPNKDISAYWEGGHIPWLNSGAVNDRMITVPSNYITDAGLQNSSARWIPPGAVLMALAGQGRTKGTVARLGIAATCNQSTAAIVLGDQLDGAFLYWWLHSNYQNIRNMAGGDDRDGLNLGLVGNIPVPLPKRDEQRSIASFLEYESAKVDALIAEQQRLIELLNEKRQAVISHATTKGLNPSAPMKDSGSPWLGIIPAHWSVKRLKQLTERIIDCPHETPVYDEDGEYLVIRTADIDCGRLANEGLYRLNRDEYVKRTRRSTLRQNDIVYGREGERWGHAALVPLNERYCLGQRMMQFRVLADFNPSFLMWQLNGRSTYLQGAQDTVGATAPHVNVSTIRNFELAVPLADEQEAIAQHLDQQTARIDELSRHADQAVALLQERRTALISAAVRGQIDVRALVKAVAA